jgi:hypothetical protein
LGNKIQENATTQVPTGSFIFDHSSAAPLEADRFGNKNENHDAGTTPQIHLLSRLSANPDGG